MLDTDVVISSSDPVNGAPITVTARGVDMAAQTFRPLLAPDRIGPGGQPRVSALRRSG